jgi:hypothetical protein
VTDVCDRCKRELALEDELNEVELGVGSRRTQRELCEDCALALLDWLDGEESDDEMATLESARLKNFRS